MKHFLSQPQLVNIAKETFIENRTLFANCLRGCKWAPDGSCIGVNSEDHHIRIFNLPSRFCEGQVNDPSSQNLPQEIANLTVTCHGVLRRDYSTVFVGLKLPDLTIRESQIIYDYCWYPIFNSLNAGTCFVLSTSRDVPIHLWSAYSGKLTASYSACNNVYELVSARSAQFSLDGSKIIAGYEKFICLFDISRPGSNGTYIYDVPNGIVSCLASGNKMFVSGSFNKLIGLYDQGSLQNIATLQGHQGGVTHLMISSNGNQLYSGARKDDEILCWDLRNLGTILHIGKRNCNTNQRIYFDLNFEQNLLATGGDDGQVRIYDLQAETDENKLLTCVNSFESHLNCVNGVGLHPSLPLMATTSGERCMLDIVEYDENRMFDYSKSYIGDTSLKFWLFQQ